MKVLIVALLSISAFGFSMGGGALQEGEEKQDGPANSISDVMKKAHGGKGIMKKAVKGEATDEELKELVSLYVDLMDNDPPKGSKEDWEAASTKVVIAATRVMLGQEGAAEMLTEATNCKACHDAHQEK